MPAVKFTIKNLDDFQRAMANSPRIVAKHLERSMRMSGLAFLAGTKENIKSGRNMWKSPIDTGLMWNTIYASFYPLKTEIRTTVDYAVYVHEGTNRMRKRPFFEITIDTEQEKIEKIFENGLEQALREVENAS